MNTAQEEFDPRVKSFLVAIEAALPAYRYVDISFVGIEHEGHETILRASLRLSAELPGETRRARSISCLRTAQMLWTGRAVAIPDLVRGILKGAPVLLGAHVLRLLPDATRGYLPYHENS